ncbi:MAG: ISAs1 family transposase, partial [Candidatus Regiella insecticola]|nr:ISAs1 family transposase [Candidatus Regiella insecticola]
MEKEQGRIETRRTVLNKKLDWLEQKNEWLGLKTVAMVESTREISKKITREGRYYLCSLTNVEQVAQTIREHWAIE